MTRLVLLIVALGAGCSDMVTNHYSTLAEAREDRIFERGWLPELLPTSTYNIRTTNNLDLSTSNGEFFMSPADVPIFISSLNATPSDTPVIYASKGYVWKFQCNQQSGHCVYQLQPLPMI